MKSLRDLQKVTKTTISFFLSNNKIIIMAHEVEGRGHFRYIVMDLDIKIYKIP